MNGIEYCAAIISRKKRKKDFKESQFNQQNQKEVASQ